MFKQNLDTSNTQFDDILHRWVICQTGFNTFNYFPLLVHPHIRIIIQKISVVNTSCLNAVITLSKRFIKKIQSFAFIPKRTAGIFSYNIFIGQKSFCPIKILNNTICFSAESCPFVLLSIIYFYFILCSGINNRCKNRNTVY